MGIVIQGNVSIGGSIIVGTPAVLTVNNIVTDSGDQLVTLSGDNLVTLPS